MPESMHDRRHGDPIRSHDAGNDHVLPNGATEDEQREFTRGKQLIRDLMARQAHRPACALHILSAGKPNQ